MLKQRTLGGEARVSGIGLHGGQRAICVLKPAPPGSGLVFVREDLGGIEIPARPEFAGRANYATILERDGVGVSTVEHLLAALYALGVDNARIALRGSEVPILDGSAAPFVQMIRSAG